MNLSTLVGENHQCNARRSTLPSPRVEMRTDIKAVSDRYRELDHKLHNRPSKADLEHLNILKGRNGVEPNIHAAQQRLMMRKRGTALEMKLHKRPNFNQLVRHNIIPEEDEYIEHEIRLWGHVPGMPSS